MTNALRIDLSLDIPAPARAPALPEPVEKGTYTVLPGEGQWIIAKKLGVDLNKLTLLNPDFIGSDPTKIRVLHPGDKLELQLPAREPKTHPNWVPLDDFPRSSTTLTLVPKTVEKGIYTVQAGEGQWAIAKKLDTDLTRLAQMNPDFVGAYPQKIRVLHPGEKIELALPIVDPKSKTNWKPAGEVEKHSETPKRPLPATAADAPPVAPAAPKAGQAKPPRTEKHTDAPKRPSADAPNAPTTPRADKHTDTPKRPSPAAPSAPTSPQIEKHSDTPKRPPPAPPAAEQPHSGRGTHSETPKRPIPPAPADPTVSIHSDLWPQQLALSRRVIQDFVPNVLNGNIQTLMAASFLPKPKIILPVVTAGVAAAAPIAAHASANKLGPVSSEDSGNFAATRLAIDGLFASDQQIGTSFKLFTPNLPPGWITNNSDASLGKAAKAHGWAAATIVIELGRVSLSENGKERLRTANIVLNTSLQPENVNSNLSDKSRLRHNYRNLNTAAVGVETTYRITATENRLKEVLTGKLTPPNPFKPETMKVGDQVTIDTSIVGTGESEWRAFFKKGIGLDAKIDMSAASGNRLVITPRNDPVTGQPTRMIIASGKSFTDIYKLSAGLILNPAMKKSEDKDFGSKAGTVGDKAGLVAGFVRDLTQLTSTNNNNHYNLVEIDLTKPAGRALYDQILRSGVIPPQKTGDEAPHIKAYGTVDFTLNKVSLNNQLAEYAERSTKAQLSSTQCIELLSRVNVDRVFTIKYSSPDAAVRTGSKTAKNSEGGDVFLPAFGFSRGEIRNVTASHNAQVCGTEKATDYANPASPTFLKLGCQLISVPKMGVEKVFDRAASIAAANEPPAYTSLTLETHNKGKLVGRAAIDYLRHYKEADAGWFSRPTLDMTWKLKPDANTEAFVERLTNDIKAFTEAKDKNEKSSFLGKVGSVMMYNNDTYTAAMSELGLFKARAENVHTLKSFSTKADVMQMLDKFATTDPTSFINMLADFRKAGGNKEPYPIDVTYFARP